ncbi:MAG: hypothetical protein IPK69_02075 [Phycisphaerales bacterium]|nr:MAG: hypothetical protein IPK69_02075 [Phycisphaerales bacterium]
MTDKQSDISDSIEAAEDAQDLDAALAELAEAQGDIDVDISELSLDDLESQVESLLSEIVVTPEHDDAPMGNLGDVAADPIADNEAAQTAIEPLAENEAIPEIAADDDSLAAAIEDAAHAADLTDEREPTTQKSDPAESEFAEPAAQADESSAITAQAGDLPSLDAQLAEMTETMLSEPSPDSPAAQSEFAASVVEASSDTPPPPGHTESPEPPQPTAPEPEPKPRVAIGAHVQRVAFTLLNPLSKPLEKASPEIRHTVGWVGVVTLFMGAVMWAVVLTRAPKESGAAPPFDLANASLPEVHVGTSTPLPSASDHAEAAGHGEAPKKEASHAPTKSTSHASKKSKSPAKKKEASSGH